MKHQRNISSLKPTTVDVGLTTLAPSRLIHWSSQKSLPLPFQLALNVDLRLLPSLGLNQTKKIQKVPRYAVVTWKCVWFPSPTKVAEECWRLSVWQLRRCQTMCFEFQTHGWVIYCCPRRVSFGLGAECHVDLTKLIKIAMDAMTGLVPV